MKVLRYAFVVLLLTACATTNTTAPDDARVTAPTDILGVRLGMPRDTVRTTLATAGTFQREERKRQEIWTVRDPRFQSLMIGYDENWNVRYVTGVAREDASLRVADLVDTATAERRAAGETYTYTWATGQPRYYVIAIGSGDRVQYYSLKKDNQEEQ